MKKSGKKRFYNKNIQGDKVKLKTIQEIRADLRDIRYYFARKESFDKLSGLNIRCEIEEKIKHYNNLMATANPNLIDLYVNLYLRENTQESVSYDMGYSQTYIYKLNRKLLEFLYGKQKEIEKL